MIPVMIQHFAIVEKLHSVFSPATSVWKGEKGKGGIAPFRLFRRTSSHEKCVAAIQTVSSALENGSGERSPVVLRF